MSEMQTAPFKVDVTPPLGAQMAYNINREIDTPVFIRGLILDDGNTRAVVVSCDFIGIYDAWHRWRRAIAEAAQTDEDHVLLHSIHQHDSMRIAPGMNEFLKSHGVSAVDEDYCTRSLQSLCERIEQAVRDEWIRVEKIMTAERRMSGLASNRRMLDEGGKYYAMRSSMCGDPALKALPVGRIDPLLRTVALAGPDGRPAAAVHFYASHPMAAYRREMASQDVPGAALKYVEETFGKDVFNIYLTGCAGNVTFGKYHLGDKEKSMAVLGRRLGRGLAANLNRLEPAADGEISFRKVEFDFPLDPEITVQNMLRELEKEGTSRTDLLRAARKVTVARNWHSWRRYPVSRLSLGDHVHILSLQGEVCVEYQLYAQSLVPEQFLACAACGNGVYFYIPTAPMYEEGGYEPDASISTPAVEGGLKTAIANVLAELI